MLGRLKDLLAGLGEASDEAQSGHWPEEVRAAAALLVEVAEMDSEFDARERAAIERLLRARFGLSEADAGALVDWARQRVAGATQILPFTRVVKDSFGYDERVELMEMLWSVVYADGVVHDYEASLMRRVAGLIYVEDADSGAARKRAQARVGGELDGAS
jgi:uncharacterized tellurite resistance protein B-like protein